MATEKICPECKTKFGCSTDGSKCWCEDLPNVIPLTEGAECLCPDCLEKKIQNSELKIQN
jgi:hypothetical protein